MPPALGSPTPHNLTQHHLPLSLSPVASWVAGGSLLPAWGAAPFLRKGNAGFLKYIVLEQNVMGSEPLMLTLNSYLQRLLSTSGNRFLWLWTLMFSAPHLVLRQRAFVWPPQSLDLQGPGGLGATWQTKQPCLGGAHRLLWDPNTPSEPGTIYLGPSLLPSASHCRVCALKTA